MLSGIGLESKMHSLDENLKEDETAQEELEEEPGSYCPHCNLKACSNQRGCSAVSSNNIWIQFDAGTISFVLKWIKVSQITRAKRLENPETVGVPIRSRSREAAIMKRCHPNPMTCPGSQTEHCTVHLFHSTGI